MKKIVSFLLVSVGVGFVYLAGFTHGAASLATSLRGADEVEFADLLFKAQYIPPVNRNHPDR